MAKRNTIKAAITSTVDTTATAHHAIDAAINGAFSGADCARTLSSICKAWAFVDGRSCKTPEGITAHAGKLGITASAVKEVLAWFTYAKEGWTAKARDNGITDQKALVDGASSFLLNLRRFDTAYIAANASRAAKANGAARKAVKSAKSAKPAADTKKGATPATLQTALAGLIQACTDLIEARGRNKVTKGVKELNNALTLMKSASEQLSKV